MTRTLTVRVANWIGDVVLGVPALRLLEAHGCALHLYGKGWVPTLLSGYRWPVTVREPMLVDRIAQLRRLARAQRSQDSSFSQRINALTMPNSFSSAAELRLAGFRVSGYADDGRSLLLAQRQRPRLDVHTLQSFWQLACGLVGIEREPPARIDLQIAPAALDRAHALVRERGWQDGYLCVAPFATGVMVRYSKKWSRFPDFVQAIARDGLPVVVCPGPGEIDEARAAYPQAEVVENLPLDTYAALLQGARVVVANDTGPAHMAAAVGAPLVSVLGPTRVAQWAPWGPNVTVLSDYPEFPSLERVLVTTRRMLSPR
jgi:heptosyltransferase-2